MFELRLITEGKADRTLLKRLVNSAAIDIPRLSKKDAEDAGGYEWLVDKERLSANLDAPDALRIGVVVDADLDPAMRWKSLRSKLIDLGYEGSAIDVDLPAQGWVGNFQTKRPLGVWLMPNNETRGNVEDFFISLIRANDDLLKRARNCVEGVPLDLLPETGRSKAIYRTWLAWQKDGSGMSPDVAFQAARYDLDRANGFLGWVRRLLDSPAV